MTRVLKFRAWDKKNKKMYTVASLDLFGAVVTLVEQPDMDIDFIDRPLSEVELMQFTGLKDKNGKEIYEGDIVTTGNGLKRVVVWDAPGFWLAKNTADKIGVNSFSTPGAYEEVIGNIHQNTELLK